MWIQQLFFMPTVFPLSHYVSIDLLLWRLGCEWKPARALINHYNQNSLVFSTISALIAKPVQKTKKKSEIFFSICSLCKTVTYSFRKSPKVLPKGREADKGAHMQGKSRKPFCYCSQLHLWPEWAWRKEGGFQLNLSQKIFQHFSLKPQNKAHYTIDKQA